MKIVVAQLGARMHYAVPRILAEAGLLERFYTDLDASQGWLKLLQAIPAPFRPRPLQQLLGRTPKGVASQLVKAFNGLGWRFAWRRRNAQNRSELTAACLWANREFCRLAVKSGFGRAGAVYAFNTAAQDLNVAAKAAGLKTILEQTIAPRRLERDLLAAEHERFPAWETNPGEEDGVEEMIRCEEAEWRTADLIFCGSDFVRQGIKKCGGPAGKCVVVPYGVDLPPPQSALCRMDAASTGPLRVLTVGAIGLRKGSPYVLEAARRLKGRAHFRMVGSVGARSNARRDLAEAVELTGQVPRSEIQQHYEWADVFLLPSICEGSATVTYEALAHGLPVICTSNTGSVVQHGIDGFVVPAREAESIVQHISTLAADRSLLRHMCQAAQSRQAAISLEAYGTRLLSALEHRQAPTVPHSHPRHP